MITLTESMFHTPFALGGRTAERVVDPEQITWSVPALAIGVGLVVMVAVPAKSASHPKASVAFESVYRPGLFTKAVCPLVAPFKG